MFEKEAEEWVPNIKWHDFSSKDLREEMMLCYRKGAEFGYNKANEEYEGKCKTAYIRGIRTMANALKEYDRTFGAWTDYFEHTVDKVLKQELEKE